MIENKLKFMLENNKLDGLINNKSEAEKLCKLGTTEEVLDLLNKYDYNETKEVFERELLEILQEINLTEEELNKVTGGKISHRQAIAKFLGVVSLAGSINMPTTMAGKATPVSAVAKKKDKSSGWMSHPTEDKSAKTLTAILGTGGFITLGTLLFYGGKKLFGLSGNEIKDEERDRSTATSVPEGMPNDQLAELAMLVAPNETWDGNLAKVNNIVVSLIQNPVQEDYTGLVNDINSEDLETYAKKGLQLWCDNTKEHYEEARRSITDTDTWNANYGLLVKARWAVWLLLVKENTVASENLQQSVELRRFGKQYSTGVAGKLAWKEYGAHGVKLKMLTNPNKECTVLSPWIGDKVGNASYAIMSLLEELPDETPAGRYMKLMLDMEDIASSAMSYWMRYIGYETE